MSPTEDLEITERHVQVDGVSARVEVAGDGPPLVFLHGSSGPRWDPGVQALAERFCVYMPEHPGFGHAERPEWVQTVRDVALWYLDLLEALGLGQLNLVGQSLGGWIAAELASVCSHSLRRLVLAAAAGLALPGERRIDQFTLSPAALTRSLFHDQSIAERLLAVEPDPDTIRLQVRNRAMTARLGWNPYMADPSLAGRLHRVRVPTLIVWGAEDQMVPPTHARAYAAEIAGSRVVLIDRCGHVPMLERPDEFARLVGDFLAAE